MRKLNLVFLLGIVFTSLSILNHAYASKQPVRIGVLSVWGEDIAREMWQPTIDYLNQEIPEQQFRLRPLTLAETIKATAGAEIDFILTNPGNYVSLEAQYEVTRILTLRTKRQDHITTQFGAIIFTRADRSDISTVADLRGKSFMAVKKNAFGGFQMAWYELKQKNINPYTDFASLSFSGFPQDKVVYAVRDSKVDAGTVRSTTLERMVKDGLVNINEFKILNEQQKSNLPFKHSTRLYPEWPLAKLIHTSDQLAKKVSIALLSITESSPVAKAARSGGWTVPLDYNSVHQLMKALQVGPYTPKPGIQTSPAKQFWLFLSIFLVIAPFIAIYIYKLKHRLLEDEQKLEQIEIEWSQALDFLDEPIYMVDLDDRLIRANKAFYNKIGTTEKNAVGKKVTLFTHPQGEETPCKVCQARNELRDTTIILEADDPANKAASPMEISIKVVRNASNKPVGIIQGMRDLTRTRATESAIRQSEFLFRGLLNTTPDPLVAINSHGIITIVNSQFEQQFGYSRNEIIGQEVEILVPEKHRDHHKHLRNNFYDMPKARPMGYNLELSGLHKDGYEIPLEISLSPFEIDNETLVIAALHNISERKKHEKELKRLASFPEENPMPIIECTTTGDITYMNKAAEQSFPELIKHSGESDVLLGVDTFLEDLKINNNQLIRDIEYHGTIYEQNIMLNDDDSLIRIYAWDITKLREMSQRMAYHASHDSLTGLPNRREFENQLELAIMTASLENKHHVICYMDLDQFKIVNDTCGHIAGDELLKQLASVLKTVIRESDILARLGGDEFGLLLTGCSVNVAEKIAEKFRRIVEEFRFHWDNKTFKVGVSIGLVPIYKDSGDMSYILSAADSACYLAKEHGRNRIHTYTINDTTLAKHTDEMNWTHRIHDALEHDRFVLYGQKIISVFGVTPGYHEVLIRMIGDDGKIIPPMAFLTAAERYNMISDIDLWVIRNTLDFFSQLDESYHKISINLSGQTLGNSRAMSRIIQYIDESKVSPERICFEITETAMISNLNSAKRFVSTLRGFGCKMALDDFGSGLSSFSYLKNLPVNYLKIDGDFVRNMDSDEINAAMVESIIQVGHKMGLEIIAEYVENDAILEKLKTMGANYAQGYGISKPKPLEDIVKPTTPAIKQAKVKL